MYSEDILAACVYNVMWFLACVLLFFLLCGNYVLISGFAESTKSLESFPWMEIMGGGLVFSK